MGCNSFSEMVNRFTAESLKDFYYWDTDKAVKEDNVNTFKIGDTVEIVEAPDTGHTLGDIGQIVGVGVDPYEWIVDVMGVRGDYDSDELKHVHQSEDNVINTKGDISMSIAPSEIKNLRMKDDDRLLLENNYMSETGEPTSFAREVLMQKLFDEKKDEIVADLKAIVKARKAAK